MVIPGNANLLIGVHELATQESGVPSEVSELSVIPGCHPSIVCTQCASGTSVKTTASFGPVPLTTLNATGSAGWYPAHSAAAW